MAKAPGAGSNHSNLTFSFVRVFGQVEVCSFGRAALFCLGFTTPESVNELHTSTGFRIVFCGDNKRLAAFGPLYWSRDNKKELLNWLGAQVDTRGITIRPTEIAMYRLSKNTRVRA